MSEVTLKIAGKQYGGWKSIDIRRSLDVAANTFSLGLTDVWPGEDVPRPVHIHSACELWIDQERIITGYIDDVSPKYGNGQRSTDVDGRSKVAVLIDCALSLGDKEQSQFNNLGFLAVAQRLASHFGLKVKDEAGISSIPAKRVYRLEPGETVFEFLAEHARVLGVRLISDADGNLVISRTSNKRVRTELRLGENIEAATPLFSGRNRFSEYNVIGQTWGSDQTSAAGAAHAIGRAKDSGVPLFRPTVIIPETDITLADATRRAEWQRNLSYGRSHQVTYTVTGWRHADGLWEPNRLVRVHDDWTGLDGVLWMISDVRYVLDETGGTRAELTVSPKEGFDLIPLPNEKEIRW